VHWNGSRWAKVKIPAALARNGILTTIIARTSRDVWAGGTIRRPNGSLAPIMAHWNGRAWHGGHWPSLLVSYQGRDAQVTTLAQVARTTSIWGVGYLATRPGADGVITLYGSTPHRVSATVPPRSH
jgi:hypothetical protein